MGDLRDYWREVKPILKQRQQQKRQHNREYSTKFLLKHNVSFVSRNEGNHLIIAIKKVVIDFWPTTGKYTSRNKKYEGRGVFNLYHLIERIKND